MGEELEVQQKREDTVITVNTEAQSEESREDGLSWQQTVEQEKEQEDILTQQGAGQQEDIPETVPVSALPPTLLYMNRREDFKNRLGILNKDLNGAVQEILKKKLDITLSDQAVKVLVKFRNYANLRVRNLEKDPKVTFTEIDTAVSDVKKELLTFEVRKRNTRQKYRNLLTTEIQVAKKPDNEKIKELHEKLDEIAVLGTLMERYGNFAENDQYDGGLAAGGPVSIYADQDFVLPAPATEEKEGESHNIVYRFKKVYDLPLFPEVPCIQDIQQGGLGDCYLLAGLATAVAADPGLIVNAMRDMGKTVRVRFYRPDGSPLYVEVEKSIPKKYDYLGTSFKGAEDPWAKNCLWVQMMEKAYMASGLRTHSDQKTGHSYQSIESGYSDIFLAQLTGRRFQRELIADGNILGDRNSLIGVYRRTASVLSAADTAVLDRMLPVTTPATLIHGIQTEVLRGAAAGMMQQHTGEVELSMEGAVAIALKLAEEEAKRVTMRSDNQGNTVRTLDRAAYLDDLQRITEISIPVPADHAPDIGVLNRLAETAGITIDQAEGGLNELFDQLDDSAVCTEETKKLAARIQEAYREKALFIPMNDAVTLAVGYEVHYKEKLAADMIKTLKKDQTVQLSYSPFYTRISRKTGQIKKRYTARAKQIYKMIDDAIAAGRMVTAATVDYQQSGDRALKAGLVERHAYSVLGALEKDGAQYVKLRNPWGRYGRNYGASNKAIEDPENNSGVFLIELNDFISNFNMVSAN